MSTITIHSIPDSMQPYLKEITDLLQRMTMMKIHEDTKPLDIFIVIRHIGSRAHDLSIQAQWTLYPMEVLLPYLENLSRLFEIPVETFLTIQREKSPECFFQDVSEMVLSQLRARYEKIPEIFLQKNMSFYECTRVWKKTVFRDLIQHSQTFQDYVDEISESYICELMEKISSIPTLSERVDGSEEMVQQFEERLFTLAKERIPQMRPQGAVEEEAIRGLFLLCIEELTDQYNIQDPVARRFIMEHMQMVPFRMFLLHKTMDVTEDMIESLRALSTSTST